MVWEAVIMGRYSAMARLACVFTACIAIIAYNVFGKLTEAAGTGTDIFETAPHSQDTEALPEEKEEISSENTETGDPQSSPEAAQSKDNPEEKAESGSSSATASVSGNVKGKILSQYISPYNAGLSYSNVYLKNGTSHKIDIKSLLSSSLSFKLKKNDEPQVLIMHTHTTETFMEDDSEYYTDAFTSRSRDKTKNMVSVGDIVVEKLNAAGIKTLHDTTEHDYPQYSGSYTRAAQTINSYLKKYPSIKVVLDLHRDAVSSGENDKVKLVTEINGKKAAQVMLVMGSQSEGESGFPDWQENLKLAVRLQQTLEVKYPTLARPISLTTGKYNESLTKGSLLIEFGTDANSLDEVHYSAELVGNALASLFNTLV